MNNDRHPAFELFNRISIPSTTLSLCVFAGLVTLSGLSCILGAFYDDEIFNIKRAALPFPNLADFVKYINSTDIHPPASYVLNKLTFDALENWKAVKFVNGTITAAAIAWFGFQTMEKTAVVERLVLTFALTTAAASELWGTGLRWNAYFNPVFLILYTVALSERPSVTVRAAILTIGTVFLFHTSYLTVVAAPILWGTFFFRSRDNLRPAIVAPIILAGVVACLPQLYVLLTVHLPWHKGNLMGGAPYLHSILYSIPQSAATMIVGDAAFPIDYVPCLFLLLLALAFASSAKELFHDTNFVMLFAAVLFGFILLVVTGIGFEGRNAAFLYPISLALIVLTICRSPSWIGLPALAALALLQITSVLNFIFHHDTAKGSFNTPFTEAMSRISTLSKECPGTTQVFTHDPVLGYLVEKSGGRLSSPYVPTDAAQLSLSENDCVLIVHTYRGVLPPKLYARFMTPLSPEHFRGQQILNLGYDRFHGIKAWIGKEQFPDYYITISPYQVLHSVTLPDWYNLTVDD
jgi:hypothetical protein